MKETVSFKIMFWAILKHTSHSKEPIQRIPGAWLLTQVRDRLRKVKRDLTQRSNVTDLPTALLTSTRSEVVNVTHLTVSWKLSFALMDKYHGPCP